jgi:hypothetical protein
MDTILPEYQCLPSRLESLAHLRKALAVPEDARTCLREILKFLGTVALLVATGVILLMVG